MALVALAGYSLARYTDGLDLAHQLLEEFQIRDRGFLLAAASSLEACMTSDLERGLVAGYRLAAIDLDEGTAGWLND
jgi:hypothetical protein